jgi:SAM-dependent methyltransferase
MSVIQEIHNFWGIGSKNIHGEEFTGYESVYSQLDKFDKPAFNRDPEGTISSVFDIYRSINLVPIIYFTERGVLRAIRDFKDSSYNTVNNSRINLGNNKGQPLSRFLFPNMMTAEPKGRGSNSLRDRFFDDKKLKRAIRICYEMREGNNLVYPTAVRRALELVTGENIQNFKPQNARAIVEHLCPVIWGNVYDYSCGYGGRLLGIGSSNMKYNYIGVDPNTETVKYLNYYNECIEEAVGVKGVIHCDVSENFQPTDIDLAFSSPPYFNLEKYTDEDTQCMVRYKTLEEWFNGYVEPTMQNIYNGLNSEGLFATNIADYKSYGNKEYKVVEDWIKTAERIGFKHVSTIKMMLNTRPGVGNQKLAGREKYEGVYVFKK